MSMEFSTIKTQQTKVLFSPQHKHCNKQEVKTAYILRMGLYRLNINFQFIPSWKVSVEGTTSGMV